MKSSTGMWALLAPLRLPRRCCHIIGPQASSSFSPHSVLLVPERPAAPTAVREEVDLLIEWQLFLISHVSDGTWQELFLSVCPPWKVAPSPCALCEMRTCVEQSWKGDPSRPLNKAIHHAWRDESLIDYIRECKSHRTPLTSLIRSSRTYQHICTNEIRYNLNPVLHQDQYVDSWQ